MRRVRGENLIGPTEFVPHVERTPLVRTLTLAVARDALRRLPSGMRQGTSWAPPSTSRTG